MLCRYANFGRQYKKVMPALYESDVEKFAMELLIKQGYVYLSPGEQALERESLSEVFLRNRLKTSIDNLN